MKVEIILEKIANLKPTKYHLRWEYQDDEVSSVDSCTDIQSIRKQLIARISLMPHAEGAIMHSLLRKLKGIGFQPWEVHGILDIISKFDHELYEKIWVTTPNRQVAWQFFCTIREQGRVVELQRHFKLYGVSASMFYRWFYDPTTGNRKDLEPDEGMGRFTYYQLQGLMQYLKRFPENNKDYKTMPGITEIIITDARTQKQDGVQE